MRAFLSVSDKTGLTEFAQKLHALGVELVSTGGTAKALQSAGIPVTGVEQVTGFPECLDGRVKTLHPNIHAGILAMRGNEAHMQQLARLGVTPIDIVVVNLYPFRQTVAKPGVLLEEAVENIDIGGPSMLRAAAKNYEGVTVVVDAADYPLVAGELEKGGVSRETRFRLATKVFEHTAAYDALIASYLRQQTDALELPAALTLTFDKVQSMRYGENPHQRAALYREPLDVPGSLALAQQLQGKELSFNNINDANGALELLCEFDETAVVAVKHANPCGAAVADSVLDAYEKARDGDPVSIYGGIVACNAAVDAAAATAMTKTFLEIVVAPEFTPEALDIFSQKKNLRILRLPSIMGRNGGDWDYKRVLGGLLVQQKDTSLYDGEWDFVTQKKPTPAQMRELAFAWKVVKHVKSNGIAVARGTQTLGIGPGQTNRIWAVQQAIERSGELVRGAVLASDAYFPFDDSVRAAAKAGIAAIIQPGGSVHDQDSIDACNELGLPMVFTRMRHFKH